MNEPAETHAVVRRLVVSIDGPSGSGKTTTARLVAARLGLRHVDTGAMYRAITWRALNSGLVSADANAVARLARETTIEFGDDGGIVVDGKAVDDSIRSDRVTQAVSAVSANAGVREAMVAHQRAIAQSGGVVLEGRDIGSVVVPWADLKIYLDARLPVRAERRWREWSQRGDEMSLEAVATDLARRDHVDSTRETSPLTEPVGSFRVDTSELDIVGQVDAIVELAERVAARIAAIEGAHGSAARRRRFRPLYRFGYLLNIFVSRVIFGLKIQDRMRGDLDENYIFASNHISNADPPFVGSTFHVECRFVAKAPLFKVPLLGSFLRGIGAIPIRRSVFDREAMASSERVLLDGQSLMIFPEGGRVRGGELAKARSGVGYLAIRTGVTVLPVYVTGTDRLRDCLFRRCRMRVVHGPPIRIDPERARELAALDDRDLYRRYSESVMSAIAALKSREDASNSL